jgi:hypothetical protein
MTRVRELLFKNDPYDGFDASKYEFDLQGWNGDSNMLSVKVDEVKPMLACEVGSWKGMSAANIASHMPKGGELVCVDTWLGAQEFWTLPPPLTREKRDLKLVNGYPSIYYQFLANMSKLSLQETVTPFPITSQIAAGAFAYWGVKFDFIYVDASHEYRDVKDDINVYWDLLNPGGYICGDDYGGYWDGVTLAVNEFVNTKWRNLEIDRVATTWCVKK